MLREAVAAKIMEKSAVDIRQFTGGCPGLAEVTNGITVVVKHIFREPFVAVFVLDGLRFAAPFNDGKQFAF